jgi:hypothetical protein
MADDTKIDAFDIYCSFHRKNSNIVEKIIEKFQEYFSVWSDQTQDESFKEIEDSIKSSSVIICFITKSYCKSKDCIKELQLANQMKKLRLIVILEKKITDSVLILTANFLKFNAFQIPNVFDPWSENLYQQLFNLISDLVNKRKLQFETIIEDKFLPLNPYQLITKTNESKNNVFKRPHVLKTIIETQPSNTIELNENVYNILLLPNSNLFCCNGRDGFSIYNENFKHIKTIKKLGVCCFAKNIYCYYAAVDPNGQVICCCEISPWNTDITYYAIITTDFDLKKIKIISTYDQERRSFDFFQGIFYYKDWLYISTSDELIKFKNLTFDFETLHKFDFEPNEVALVNDVLCVTRHKSILFYDIDTFYIKYKYSSSGNYEISVLNNNFYIFCEQKILYCYEQDGKLLETGNIFINNNNLCKHSRGRLIYYQDKILIQNHDSKILNIFDLKNLMS